MKWTKYFLNLFSFFKIFLIDKNLVAKSRYLKFIFFIIPIMEIVCLTLVWKYIMSLAHIIYQSRLFYMDSIYLGVSVNLFNFFKTNPFHLSFFEIFNSAITYILVSILLFLLVSYYLVFVLEVLYPEKNMSDEDEFIFFFQLSLVWCFMRFLWVFRYFVLIWFLYNYISFYIYFVWKWFKLLCSIVFVPNFVMVLDFMELIQVCIYISLLSGFYFIYIYIYIKDPKKITQYDFRTRKDNIMHFNDIFDYFIYVIWVFFLPFVYFVVFSYIIVLFLSVTNYIQVYYYFDFIRLVDFIEQYRNNFFISNLNLFYQKCLYSFHLIENDIRYQIVIKGLSKFLTVFDFIKKLIDSYLWFIQIKPLFSLYLLYDLFLQIDFYKIFQGCIIKFFSSKSVSFVFYYVGILFSVINEFLINVIILLLSFLFLHVYHEKIYFEVLDLPYRVIKILRKIMSVFLAIKNQFLFDVEYFFLYFYYLVCIKYNYFLPSIDREYNFILFLYKYENKLHKHNSRLLSLKFKDYKNVKTVEQYLIYLFLNFSSKLKDKDAFLNYKKNYKIS